MERVYQARDGEVWHGDSTEALPDGERWAACITDPRAAWAPDSIPGRCSADRTRC